MVKNTEIKKEIRRQALERRGALFPDFRAQAGKTIREHFLSCKLYNKCRDLFCYVSFRDEVDTQDLILQALKDGHRVAVPRVLSGKDTGRRMEFYYIGSLGELHPGAWGILEPGEELSKIAIPDKNSLIVMPGAAFDRCGGRVGYGGGYYDTYLQEHASGKRVALAFSAQLLEHIPSESHDIRTDMIITEKEIIACS